MSQNRTAEDSMEPQGTEVKLLWARSSCRSLVLPSKLGGTGPTKLFMARRSIARFGKWPSVVGKVPVNAFPSQFRERRFLKFAMEAGKEPVAKDRGGL